jgi:hypothetical protein
LDAGSNLGDSFHIESHATLLQQPAGAEAVPRPLDAYVPRSIDDGLLSFLTSAHPETDIEPSCHVDIARKRDAGLLLAPLCGWRTIMYLDDGIRDLTASAVSRAAALTGAAKFLDLPDRRAA